MESKLSTARKDVGLEQALPEEVIRALRDAGVPKSAIRRLSVFEIPGRPVSQLIIALREASPIVARLSATLAGWDPRASIA
jgi:hypothetical protein